MRKRKNESEKSWVIYQAITKGAIAMNSVCKQAEWEEMERFRPEAQTFVKNGDRV